MSENTKIGVNEQGAQAKRMTVEQFGLDEAVRIGDYTFIAAQEVAVDGEGNTATQYVEIELTVKSQKATTRSKGFNLDEAIAAYADTLVEREAKAAEKAAKAAAKAEKEAARQAAKAALEAIS